MFKHSDREQTLKPSQFLTLVDKEKTIYCMDFLLVKKTFEFDVIIRMWTEDSSLLVFLTVFPPRVS